MNNFVGNSSISLVYKELFRSKKSILSSLFRLLLSKIDCLDKDKSLVH